MSKLLVINSSPLTDNSKSRELLARFVDGYASAHPGTEVVNRDVGRNPPPVIDEVTIGAFYTAPDQLNAGQKQALALSDTLVAELEAADTVVIAAPMHNFTISAALKTYIDQVARVGRTFQYGENGPEGLLKDKKVYVITTSGGNYVEGSPAAYLNHRDNLLKTVLGFIGLTDVEFIHASGVAAGVEGVEQAQAEIEALFAA